VSFRSRRVLSRDSTDVRARGAACGAGRHSVVGSSTRSRRANSPLVPGRQLFERAEDIQFLIELRIRLVGPGGGSTCRPRHHLVTRSTFVALVFHGLSCHLSPQRNEFVRQVSHADLRVGSGFQNPRYSALHSGKLLRFVVGTGIASITPGA